MSIKTYKDLEIWQIGKSVVKDVYQLTGSFPKEELYGLTSQMRRAAISIPSNVAEGFRRRHTKEYKQFLHIALGSCAELETQIIIAKELSYCNSGEDDICLDKLDHIGRMITSLSKKL